MPIVFITVLKKSRDQLKHLEKCFQKEVTSTEKGMYVLLEISHSIFQVPSTYINKIHISTQDLTDFTLY